ncbi:MAG TPA: LD-carboxypeptidase [Verrucomicrobiae bacterium]|nr:LD-carboxypeptidase [Verrucomicrobiae bacterium]
MPHPLKPSALRPGDTVRILSLSSPVDPARLDRGVAEITRLGYKSAVDRDAVLGRDGFFAGPGTARSAALREALGEPSTKAIVCSRGGYGANYLLPDFPAAVPGPPKIFVGYSDITSIQLLLWKRSHRVTFYGPMVASGFDHGPAAAQGYDIDSWHRGVTETQTGWKLPLESEPLVPGSAEGILLGGCMTLLETSLGTPWELDTRGSILILEDRGMKPWQVDRALTHLFQAGKFQGIAGILMGDFPDCEAPQGTESVRDVARRILVPLGVPLVWGAPIGHTARPMLTLPLGIRARLGSPASSFKTSPCLEILEPACAP